MTMQEYPELGGPEGVVQFEQFAPGTVYTVQGGQPEAEVSPEQRVEQAKQQLAEFWQTNRERVLGPIQNGTQTLEHAQTHAATIREHVAGSATRALTALAGYYKGESAARGASGTAEDNLTAALERYEESQHPQTLQKLFGGLPGLAEATKGLLERAVELRDATLAKQATGAGESVPEGAARDNLSTTEQTTTDNEPAAQPLEVVQAQWLVESLAGQLPTLNWMAPHARDLVGKFINPYDLTLLASAHRTEALPVDTVLSQLQRLQTAIDDIGEQSVAAVSLATAFDQVSSTLFAWAHHLDAGISVIAGSAKPKPGAQA